MRLREAAQPSAIAYAHVASGSHPPSHKRYAPSFNPPVAVPLPHAGWAKHGPSKRMARLRPFLIPILCSLFVFFRRLFPFTIRPSREHSRSPGRGAPSGAALRKERAAHPAPPPWRRAPHSIGRLQDIAKAAPRGLEVGGRGPSPPAGRHRRTSDSNALPASKSPQRSPGHEAAWPRCPRRRTGRALAFARPLRLQCEPSRRQARPKRPVVECSKSE